MDEFWIALETPADVSHLLLVFDVRFSMLRSSVLLEATCFHGSVGVLCQLALRLLLLHRCGQNQVPQGLQGRISAFRQISPWFPHEQGGGKAWPPSEQIEKQDTQNIQSLYPLFKELQELRSSQRTFSRQETQNSRSLYCSDSKRRYMTLLRGSSKMGTAKNNQWTFMKISKIRCIKVPVHLFYRGHTTV